LFFMPPNEEEAQAAGATLRIVDHPVAAYAR
jgi:hypothetical protein